VQRVNGKYERHKAPARFPAPPRDQPTARAAEEYEGCMQEVAEQEGRATTAALDCVFRFFREWMSTTHPDADAFVEVARDGLIVAKNQAGWNVDWMHDMKSWSEGVTFNETPTPKWGDVQFPTASALQRAASRFREMSVEELNSRLAPVMTVHQDYGETGCEGGRRLEVREGT